MFMVTIAANPYCSKADKEAKTRFQELTQLDKSSGPSADVKRKSESK